MEIKISIMLGQEPKNNNTNPELQKYYKYLKDNNADVPPTYSSFENTLKDPKSAQGYYNYLRQNNFDAPETFDSFQNTFGLKKKDSTSTSTTPKPKSASEQKVGSSGTQEFELKPVFDERGRQVKIKNEKGELVPYMEKVPKGFASSTEEREIVREEQKKKASKPIIPSANLTKYKEATKITDDEKAILQQEVEDEFNQKGIWNGVKAGMKKGFNFLADVATTIGTFGTETEAPIQMEVDPFAKEKKQAKEELVAEKKAVTPQAIAERAKQIKIQKRLDGLKVDKNNEYLSNLPEEEVKALNLEKVREYKTLSDKDKYLATKAELLKNDFEKDAKDLFVVRAILDKNKKEGVVPNENLVQFAIEKEASAKQKLKEAEELEKDYIANKENIGTSEEEIDFLKRNYDTTDKVITLAKLGFGEIYNSVANKLPLMVSDLDQAIFEPLRPGSSEGVLSEEERQELIDKSIDWENAKELAKSGVKKDITIDNLNSGNFGQFFFQELGTQLSTFAQMAMPGGIISIGMTSAFDKYGRMEQESNNISFEFDGKQFSGFKKENGEIVDSLGNTYDPNKVKITSLRTPDQSTANKFFTAVTFGTAEAVLGALPTKNIFGRALNSLSTSGERTLFRESIKQFAKAKGAGVLDATATEVVSEGATQVVQNIADIASGKKDVGVFDNVDHAAVSAGMLSFFMSASPAIAGIALKPFAQNKENKQVNDNLQQIFALQEQLNNAEISDVSRAAIQNKIEGLEKANGDILDGIASRTKGVSKEVFDAIKDVNKKQEILTIQATEIKNDSSLDVEVKKQLIADLESQFNQLEKKRATLVGGSATVLDALPDSESTRLKQEAAETLVKEEKAKGKADSEINFTEEQINAKAIEIYNQSNQNAVQQEATITETKQKAQPQAEVQETEQEVLEENSKQKDIDEKKSEIEKLEEERKSLEGNRTEINVGDTFNYNFGLARDGLVTVIRDNNDGTVQTRYADGTIKKERKSNLISYLNEQNGVYNEINKPDNTAKSIELNSKIEKLKKELKTLEESKSQTESQENNISDINRVEIFEKSDGTFNVRETNKDGTLKQILGRFKTKEEAQTYLDTLKNETTQTIDTTTDGNIQPTIGEVAEVGGTTEQITEDVTTESIPQTVEPTTSKRETKRVVSKTARNPKTGEAAEFDVDIVDGQVVEIRKPRTGKVVPKFVEVKDKATKKVKRIQRNANWTAIADEALGFETSNRILEQEKKATEEAIQSFEPSNEYEHALQFFATGGNVNSQSAQRETGLSNKEVKWATGFKPDSELPSVEAIAEKIVMDAEKSGVNELDMQEVRNALIDIIKSYTRDSVKQEIVDTQKSRQEAKEKSEEDAYLNSLTKEEYNEYQRLKAETLIERADQEFLESMTEDEIRDYYQQKYNEQQQFIQEVYGTEEIITEREGSPEVSNIEQREEVSENKGDDGKVDRPKSKKEVKKKIAEAKIDEIADWLKNVLPKADINPEDYKTQGFTQDQLIDLIANVAKSLISKGIDINEAINQVIDALKQKFDFEVDVDKIKEKIEPKKKSKKEKAVSELNDFKKEKGKKSLLSRISEGTNEIVKNAIRNISLDYDVESIEGAKEAAKEIFRKLGLEESIVALSDRNSELQGAVRAFVFREASFFLENEISKMQENGIDDSVLQKFDALNDALAKIKEEMDMFGRDGGRFINALQYIYRESNGEYSLSKRVKEWESARGGEKIPAELLEKFAEAEKKAKELTEKLLELQKEKERLEAQASLEIIIEDIEQTGKSKKPKRKFAVSEEKRKERQKLKQEILKDYFGGLNDVTRFVAMLADPKVIKYLKLTLEENGGDFIDFSNALIDDLGKDVRKHVKELFLKAGGKETEITGFNHSDIIIDKEGKIKVPKAVLIDLIQQGFTEIDALSQKVLDIISEDYPDTDYTLREVRDAITNYGKTIKPTENELLKKLGEMTRLGRLLSQLEDVQNGTRPKKSGLQRQKPTDLERELTRKINDLLRDNLIPLSDSETEAFIKSQNDKIKTRLENEIRDLEKQITLGERRKVDRKPIEYSNENKELKSRRDALKEQLDALTGKPELTEEQKIKRAERLLEASIDKIQQQLLTKQVEFAKKPDPINSAKLEELRAKRKFLLEQRDTLRKDLGLIEKRRLELAKKSRERRIAEIKRRLKEKDFSKKQPQPLKVDKEILEIQMELDKLKEIYEKEKYEHELEQQSLFYRVAKNLFLGIYNIPRSMLATSENSTVLIQNGYLTISDLVDDIVKTPKNLINYFRKSSESSSDKFKTTRNLRTLFSALGSAEFEENSRRELEADPLYPLAKKSGLQITTTNGKLDAKQEAFIHDMVAVALDTPGYILKYATKDKKYTPIGNKFLNIARKALGKQEVKVEEKTALEQVKNINPQRALERGMVAYSNRMIMKKFKEGAFLLEQAGKNPIDNLEDYKQLANAINNLSGRGNLYVPFINSGKGRYLTIDPSLGSVIFFSYKLASTYLNTMNPFWHYSLKDSDSPFYKPSYAQKMAWITMAKFVTFSTGMTLLYAAAIAGQDDEDEKSIYKTGYIETDPRSVNFGRIYQGNGIWVDMFVGKMQAIPLMTRVFTGESKNRYTGKIEELGYDGTPKRWDIMFQYGANKLTPTTRIAFDYANAKLVENKETGKMEKIVGFEQEPFNILKSMTMNAPLYWQTIANLKESEKERNVYNEALIASMFFGAPGISEDPFYNESKYDVRKLRAEERFRGYALDGLAKRLHFKEITEEEINEELKKMYEGEYTSEYIKGVQRVQRRLLEYSAEEAYLKIAKANSKKEKALYLLEEFGDIYEHPNQTEVLKELKRLGFDFKKDNMTRQYYNELLEKRNK